MREKPLNRELDNMMKVFRDKARTRGAVLLAVCKGKVAEGIDFSDELCRTVFLIGIPYAPMKDAKVVHKQKYLEAVKQKYSH